MSAPVDVLAVMTRAVGNLLRSRSQSVANSAVEMREARAAVADLIEALSLALRQNSHDMVMTGEELRTCEAALARVGGAK